MLLLLMITMMLIMPVVDGDNGVTVAAVTTTPCGSSDPLRRVDCYVIGAAVLDRRPLTVRRLLRLHHVRLQLVRRRVGLGDRPPDVRGMLDTTILQPPVQREYHDRHRFPQQVPHQGVCSKWQYGMTATAQHRHSVSNNGDRSG